MAGAASAHQAASASREETSQQRAGRRRRTSADPQLAQQGATAAAADAPAALDSLSRLQQLADASPQVAQLRRLQALADGRFAPVAQLAGGPEEELVQGKFATAQLQPQLQQAPRVNNTGLPDQLKSGIESLSGLSMDHVRVNYNSSQPAQLNALAYAQGSDIHLAPGQERHLPHEAWHVVQQAQGRVKATMQIKEGVEVNDEKGLEGEAEVMGGQAVSVGVAQGKPIESDTNDIAAHGGAIQLKGERPLMESLRPNLPWAMKNIGSHVGNYDTHLKPLFNKINEYDRRSAGKLRPDLLAEKHALDAMIANIIGWISEHPQAEVTDLAQIVQIQSVLVVERETVRMQISRWDRHTATDDSPYDQMTEEGMLWSSPLLEYSTKALEKKGKAYFSELSKMNRRSMGDEVGINKLESHEWFTGFVERAKGALGKAVVNHYTTSTRARTMVGGGMKSKMMLEKTAPGFKHNTSAYDDIGLGNTGFLFFFIESPNTPPRDTRFAKGDDSATPARISIPIEESGLLSKGWIMLSDFAQREYPNVYTNKENSQHETWLSTREEEERKKPGNESFTEPVRNFKHGSVIEQEDEYQIESEPDKDRRQVMSTIIPQTRGDKDSKQIYTGPKGKLEISDRIFQNVLVGADIIPGLATRAALEVARISHVNQTLGATMQSLDGDPLMLFMLKDLFRPQAMIPNGLAISSQHVQPPLREEHSEGDKDDSSKRRGMDFWAGRGGNM